MVSYSHELALSKVNKLDKSSFENPNDSIKYYNWPKDKVWNYLNATPITNDSTKEVYRLSQIPSFRPPIVLTATRMNEEIKIVLRHIHDKLPEVVVVETSKVFPEDWSNFLTEMEKYFWGDGLNLDSPPVYDGTSWLIEGTKSGNYKIISRKDVSQIVPLFNGLLSSHTKRR